MWNNKHRYKTLDKYVYYSVIEKIKTGELKPNERLTEDRISKELNVSRSPIRRAFSSLVAQGILEHRSYSGVVVKDILVDSTRYAQLLDVIQLFIKAAFEKSDHTEERIYTDHLDNCILSMEKSSYLQNLTDYNFNKNQFLLSLIQYADNPYYLEIAKKVIFNIEHFTHTNADQLTEEMRERLIGQFKIIVELLKKANYKAAYQEVQNLFGELVVYAFH